jgi:hypothetical protein
MTTQVLHAVLKDQEQANGCSLEELNFSQWYTKQSSKEALTQLLQTSKSLRRLKIHRERDSDNMEWLGHALGSNTSLEHLDIDSVWYGFHAEANFSTILSSLASHPRIQTLNLGWSHIVGETLQALVDLLTQTLSLRSLQGCFFTQELTAEDAALFIKGLQSNQGSLTKLVVHGHDSPQFLAALVAYFKSPASLQNNLRELHLGHFSLDGMAEAMEIQGSVGSSLQVFAAYVWPTTNTSRPDVVRFLNTLASQGSRNKLKALYLYELADENSTAALANCLPRLVNLVDLQVDPYRLVNFGDDVKCDLVKALKRNGSLVKVSVKLELNHRYQRHVTAICDRNEQMPLLLGRRLSGSGTGSVAAATNPAEETGEPELAADNTAIAVTAVDDAAAITTVTNRMKLVPALLAAALDTPRMTPHT